MGKNDDFGFGRFVPGFDFLQNLAKGAAQTLPQMPNLSSWIAPTLNVEDLEKRIGELKAVHFWLDQNSKALGATIQALEVQKMTLATLRGMNFNMGEVANALTLKAADAAFTSAQKMTGAAGEAAPSESSAPASAAASRKPARKGGKAARPAAPAGGVVDPLQWWGALTQQFQQIAATAMRDAAGQTAADMTRAAASGAAKQAMKTATGAAPKPRRTAGKVAGR